MARPRKQSTNKTTKAQSRTVAIPGSEEELELHTALAGTLGLTLGEYFRLAAKTHWKEQLEQVRTIKSGINLGEPVG